MQPLVLPDKQTQLPSTITRSKHSDKCMRDVCVARARGCVRAYLFEVQRVKGSTGWP
jgi:hypothetical protein